jgi:hypothetical protein
VRSAEESFLYSINVNLMEKNYAGNVCLKAEVIVLNAGKIKS